MLRGRFGPEMARRAFSDARHSGPQFPGPRRRETVLSHSGGYLWLYYCGSRCLELPGANDFRQALAKKRERGNQHPVPPGPTPWTVLTDQD